MENNQECWRMRQPGNVANDIDNANCSQFDFKK
jgi:hypothetical protein